jgi:hypothetical protein
MKIELAVKGIQIQVDSIPDISAGNKLQRARLGVDENNTRLEELNKEIAKIT